MWEKETNYKLSLKKNILYEFCHEAYKKSENFDVVFITKDNYKLQAHRVILALSSDLVKNLDIPDYIDCVIELPDYSAAVVSCFIQFIYTGETLMDFELQEEFLSLCKQMMVNIPGLCAESFAVDGEEEADSKESYFMEIEEEIDEVNEIEDIPHEESKPKVEESNAELITDESFDDHGTSRGTIYPSSLGILSNKVKLRTESRTNFEIQAIKLLPPESSKESSQEKKLQEAINAVENGMITRKAALKYGVPKTTLYRKLSKMKKNKNKS